MSVLTSTIFRRKPQTPIPTHPIRLIQQRRSRHKYLVPKERQLDVEIMIRHIHPPSRLLIAQPGRSLHSARKALISRIKGCFPELRELVEDIGHGGLISLIIHEDDGALIPEDEFA